MNAAPPGAALAAPTVFDPAQADAVAKQLRAPQQPMGAPVSNFAPGPQMLGNPDPRVSAPMGQPKPMGKPMALGAPGFGGFNAGGFKGGGKAGPAPKFGGGGKAGPSVQYAPKQ